MFARKIIRRSIRLVSVLVSLLEESRTYQEGMLGIPLVLLFHTVRCNLSYAVMLTRNHLQGRPFPTRE